MKIETIEGIIEVIKPIQQITESFVKREFVIKTMDDYPQEILIEMVNDSCAILDNYQIGQLVTVSINIRGRKWINPEGVAKYFNTLQGWKIQLSVSHPSENDPTLYDPRGMETKEENPRMDGNIEKRFEDDAIDNMTEDDDLPF